jgi:hypothetical protein
MASVSSHKSRLYVGIAHFSGFTRGFEVAHAIDMLDTTTILDTAMQFIPGTRTGTASADFLYDTVTTAGGQAAVLNSWAGTPQVVSAFPNGATVGSECQLILANDANVTVQSQRASVVAATIQMQPDGLLDVGVSLSDLTAISADTNGTTVDGGAATANGGVAHLHVTAFTGLTSDSVIVEHSTNDSVWATLGTFTSVTGTTSERLVIAAGTTVNRYLRVRDDVTGTGTCTRAVAFSRR